MVSKACLDSAADLPGNLAAKVLSRGMRKRGDTRAARAQKLGLELSNTALAALIRGMSVVVCCVLKSTLRDDRTIKQCTSGLDGMM